MQMDPDRCVRL